MKTTYYVRVIWRKILDVNYECQLGNFIKICYYFIFNTQVNSNFKKEKNNKESNHKLIQFIIIGKLNE